MSSDDLIRLSVFMFFVGLITVFNGFMAVRLFLNRNKPKEEKPGKTSIFRILFYILFPAEILCLINGFFIEPYRPEVTFHSIESPKIPQGQELTLVHISDIHAEEFGSREMVLLKKVTESAPDMILCTGDLANYAEDFGHVREVLDGLQEIAPLFLVTGNVDCRFMREVEELKKDFRFLDSGAAVFTVRGISVTLTGADECLPMVIPAAAVKLKGNTDYSILLYHNPSLAKETYLDVFDLYLCGHTHGGQVRLPFFGAVITLSRYGKEFESGMYTLGKTMLYVNRGYGFEGGSPLIPKVRFLCRPEIAVFTLTGTGAAFEGN